MRITDKYVFFWGGVFSQWAKSTFKDVNGEQFTSCEQYMMYKKAELFNDKDTAIKILATNDVKKIKQLGREVQNFNNDVWDAEKLKIVISGNVYKFTQNESLKAELLKHKGKTFVEASPQDIIWGIGLHYDDDAVLDPKQWKGQNLLGIALTKVRNVLEKQ